MAEVGISVSGRLTPLRFEILPGDVDDRDRRGSRVASVMCSFTLPSSISTVWPGRSARRISGCGRCTRSTSPGVGSLSSTKVAPFGEFDRRRRRRCRRAASGPAGRPGCRSAGLNSASIERIMRMRSRIASWLAWLMLMRNTSAPASNSLTSISRSCGGGPERREDLHAPVTSHRVSTLLWPVRDRRASR